MTIHSHVALPAQTHPHFIAFALRLAVYACPHSLLIRHRSVASAWMNSSSPQGHQSLALLLNAGGLYAINPLRPWNNFLISDYLLELFVSHLCRKESGHQKEQCSLMGLGKTSRHKERRKMPPQQDKVRGNHTFLKSNFIYIKVEYQFSIKLVLSNVWNEHQRLQPGNIFTDKNTCKRAKTKTWITQNASV